MTIGRGVEIPQDGKTYKLLDKIRETELDAGNYKQLTTVYIYTAECDGEVYTVKIHEDKNGKIVLKVMR